MSIKKYSVILVAFLALVACRKPADTIVRITVENSAGDGLSDKEVRLDYEYATDSLRDYIRRSATTNADGLVSFNYTELFKEGQGGFLTLDVYVDSIISGLIEIKQNEVNYLTITK